MGFFHPVAGIFQGDCQQTAESRIVVDNEDGREHRSPSFSCGENPATPETPASEYPARIMPRHELHIFRGVR